MTTINIERLTTGTPIAIPGYDAVEVYEVGFDGEGYEVTYCTDDRHGWDATDTLYVNAGDKVEYVGRGEPSLRSEADVNRAEWEAKTAACDASIAAAIAELDARAKRFRELADDLDRARAATAPALVDEVA